ncbi:hypothetical protein TNCV_1240351 [Trichonephila clavipes]|uniref:Uncharacterized protein n=1 Tax=Trichonephila clavipes TaxID=2585209 RepID=A0A8X7BK15_TRICX|nr:hypothetical protein TNCV_1240351 [Trichonephila clavipes]
MINLYDLSKSSVLGFLTDRIPLVEELSGGSEYSSYDMTIMPSDLNPTKYVDDALGRAIAYHQSPSGALQLLM